MIAPIVDELATELAGKALVAKLDIDDAQDIALKYGVSAIPTFIVFKDGQAVSTKQGMQPKAALIASLGL
jgi:thioredoxin 1